MSHDAGYKPQSSARVADKSLSPLLRATRETSAEAVVNTLLTVTFDTGIRGQTSEAISIDRVIEICKRYGANQP